MIRRLRPRRLAVGALLAALVAGTVAVTGGTALAGDGRHGDRDHGVRTGQRTGNVERAAERAADPTFQAPPRPPRVRPVQRVVGAASTGAAGMTTLAATATPTAARSGAGAPGAGTARTLVVYDSTGPYGWLGEAYAMLAANLVSRFGSWTAHPVGSYTAGELSGYTGVVYLGSTYDEPLPVAFLDDVLSTRVPVIWAYDNIWQLTARRPDFAAVRGFTWQQFDFAAVAEVRYHGRSLTRDTVNGSGIMADVITDPTLAVPLATAVRPDGTTFPWAVRSGNLTYVGEIPFAYVTHDDRYLAFADLLYDALAPSTAERHRALVRIEDVGPDSDPAELKAVADYLFSQKVPFTVAVYPRYRDPNGALNGGVPEDYTLRRRPAVVNALKYMQARGGTLLMHGYTHQLGSAANPYDGVSANDFEFFLAHVDATNTVVYDGPVPGDSATWATGRIVSSSAEFLRAGLATPKIFEFPHYAGSATDYKAVAAAFATRYDRGLYFPGLLSGSAPDHTRIVGQFFPYPVRDVYGTAVVPENLGNVEPEAFNNHPPRLPADILASAERNLVVRDGVASFFYHPYLGTDHLRQIVAGVKALGYTFVPASAMLIP